MVEPLDSKRRRLLLIPGRDSSRERFELLLLPVADRRREAAEKFAELALVDTERTLPGLEETILCSRLLEGRYRQQNESGLGDGVTWGF